MQWIEKKNFKRLSQRWLSRVEKRIQEWKGIALILRHNGRHIQYVENYFSYSFDLAWVRGRVLVDIRL